MLAEVESTATRLLNSQTEDLKNYQKRKQTLLTQIEKVKEKAKKDAKMGVVHVNNHDQRYAHRNETINEANQLEEMVNNLSANKLIEFHSLLDNLLIESSNEGYRKMLERSRGEVTIDARTQSVLNSIKDDMLRQFTYLAFIKNNSLTGDELIKAGKELMEMSLNSTFESRLALEEEKIREELENARVDKEIIKKIMAKNAQTAKEKLSQMQSQATKEVIGETVRQQSLKVIIKAIANRGFIVDKKNIRINKETNEVHMVALKASGERADFKIYGW